MRRWQFVPAKAVRLGSEQIFVATIIYEDNGSPVDARFYCSNPTILNQIVIEHNKLVDMFKASKKEAK